ncbi:MAG: helix-hairpin-helix domain-containing protein [Ruminococcaceae bacterium]|nr:helix-hairpin-helix domain-containing protein [Oscillospiraceae bacterium]
MRGNITKSEKILLFCTAVFLLLICGACFWEITAGRSSGWTVETISAAETEEWFPADAGRININTAPVELLKELPGIGDTLAARIIEYREAHGPFAVPEEIMEVKGIGEKTYRNLEEMITVEGAAT